MRSKSRSCLSSFLWSKGDLMIRYVRAKVTTAQNSQSVVHNGNRRHSRNRSEFGHRQRRNVAVALFGRYEVFQANDDRKCSGNGTPHVARAQQAAKGSNEHYVEQPSTR